MSKQPFSTTSQAILAAAARVRCGLGHSGNTTLSRLSSHSSWWECNGCGPYYAADQIVAAATAQRGAAGLRRIDG